MHPSAFKTAKLLFDTCVANLPQNDDEDPEHCNRLRKFKEVDDQVRYVLNSKSGKTTAPLRSLIGVYTISKRPVKR